MLEGSLFFCSPNARKEWGGGGHAAYGQTTSQILKGAKEKQFFWAGQKMNYIRVENSCVCVRVKFFEFRFSKCNPIEPLVADVSSTFTIQMNFCSHFKSALTTPLVCDFTPEN